MENTTNESKLGQPILPENSVESNLNQNKSPVSSNFTKKPVIIAIIAIFFTFVLIILFLAVNRSSKKVDNTTDSSESKPSVLNNQKVPDAPQLIIGKYNYSNPAVSLPPSVPQYSLIANFTVPRIASIAATLGVGNEMENSSPFVVFSKKGKDSSTLAFNKKTGAFMAGFPVDLAVGAKTLTNTQKALLFLQSIGLADASVTCDITYKNKNAPDLTFVECHRDWQKLGLPLINFAGVINMNERELLSNVYPGMTSNLSPLDPTITEVSVGVNGRARPNDFNTATVGIGADGGIAYVASNLRWIERSTPVGDIQLITKEQAISLAEKGKAKLSLSVPSGEGDLDWKDVYPANVGKAPEANVSEILMVYLEDSQQDGQISYEPYYLIRGIAFLDSGYAVKYVQALSALKSKYSSSDIASIADASQIASGRENTNNQIQLRALTPRPTPQYSEAKTPPAIPPPTSSGQGVCTAEGLKKNPGEDGKWKSGNYPSTMYVPSYGKVAIRLHDLPVGAFFIVGLDNDKPIKVQLVREIFREMGLFQQGIPIVNDTTTDTCIISGYSPAIFLYPDKTTDVTVNLDLPTTYLDPQVENNSWSVTAAPDGNLAGNLFTTRDRLYYEFDADKVGLTQPTKGYVVSKTQVSRLVSQISKQLNLKNQETQAISIDAINAVKDIKSNYIRLGLVEQKILDIKLPIDIAPKPNAISRVHIVLSEAKMGEEVMPPIILPIVRHGFTVVEVGASVAK